MYLCNIRNGPSYSFLIPNHTFCLISTYSLPLHRKMYIYFLSYQAHMDLLKYIEEYKPYHNIVPAARVLLVGQVGSGKSSFVNSVHSALIGRVEPVSYTQDASGSSVTTNVKYYYYK